METQYYLVVNGRQAGPFAIHQLMEHGMKPDTYVWREGLQTWVAAGTLPELQQLMAQPQPQTPPCQSSQPTRPMYPPRQPDDQPGYQQPVYRQPEPYGQPESYGQPYQNPYQEPCQEPGQEPGMPIEHTNWLPWAIVATVLGCSGCLTLILGIVGIVYANKANGFYRMGNRQQGDAANSTARTTTIIALVLGVIGIISTIILFATGFWENYINALSNL